MKRCIGIVWLIACGADEPAGNLVIEHQPHHRGEAIDTAWARDSAIVVGESPSFPQPLLVRVRVVDDAGADLGTIGSSPGLLGETQLRPLDTVSGCHFALPDEPPVYCTYDFDVIGLGASMLRVTARAPRRSAIMDCVYYAVIDTSTDAERLRSELDARAAACRAGN